MMAHFVDALAYRAGRSAIAPACVSPPLDIVETAYAGVARHRHIHSWVSSFLAMSMSSWQSHEFLDRPNAAMGTHAAGLRQGVGLEDRRSVRSRGPLAITLTMSECVDRVIDDRASRGRVNAERSDSADDRLTVPTLESSTPIDPRVHEVVARPRRRTEHG